MEKLKDVWVLTDSMELCGELCGGAEELGEAVSVLHVGAEDAKIYADTVYYLGTVTPERRWQDYLDTVIGLVLDKKPDLILTGATKNGRLAAGMLAAVCKTSVMTDISEIEIGDGVTAKRMVYGGTAYRTEHSGGQTTVVCVGAGKFGAKQSGKEAEWAAVDFVEPDKRIVCKGVKKKEASHVNLAAAKKVVSVGRGIGTQETLALVTEFAGKLDAAVGCSRPVAEEMKWLPREAYVGVSGVMIKPEAYIAVGISGQIQHLVGCSQSGTLIGINKDKNAPIFRYVDYGIVGDCNKVIQKLMDKLDG